MRKGLIVLFAAVFVAAMAMPAMAGMSASGFLRVKSYVSNFKGTAGAYSNDTTGLVGGPGYALPGTLEKDPETAAFVEQRLRIKFEFGEENVKAVWYIESDFGAWGDGAGNKPNVADRNVGGALGGDKINTETKNIYVWFKVPNTSVDFTVGLQGQGDAYAGVLYASDMAGIFMKGKFDPVSYKLGLAKLYENATHETDDFTIYIGEVAFSPTKEVKLGVNFYFFQDDTQKSAGNLPNTVIAGMENKKRIYTPGLNAAFNLGPATISAFAFYQTGKIDYLASGLDDIDIKAYAADVRADMNLGPGKAFLEGLYISGGDLSGSNPDYESIVSLAIPGASPGGDSAFSRTRMEILLPSPDTINNAQCLIGCSSGVASPDLGNGGRGMWHIAAGYTQKFTDKVSGQINVGYLTATKKLEFDPSYMKKDMGTEVNAQVSYNIWKGLDVGLVGAYAWVGDFFKPSSADSPDDVYDLHARLNYSF